LLLENTATMQSKRTRLDRFLSDHLSINRRDVRLLIAQKRIKIDHNYADNIQQLVDQYTRVQFDDKLLQANVPSYIMLHKPAGVVSATRDARHTTVIDLLGGSHPNNLHLAGRLDFNSTGLVLLTNDGRWSRKLSSPESNIDKHYAVTLDKPVTQDIVTAFSEGLYFSFEKLTTRPALLTIIDSHHVEVTLNEGRYHQIKRMFGQFQLKVLRLHRLSVGGLLLDDTLLERQSRALTGEEVTGIFSTVKRATINTVGGE
jgi:16S rRNA pseudouridine516 synthase